MEANKTHKSVPTVPTGCFRCYVGRGIPREAGSREAGA
jgi:hypothetical protein